MGFRTCIACRESVHSVYYSRNQWNKGPGASRCEYCVVDDRSRVTERHVRDSARINASHSSRYNPMPFAEGNFRWVCKGTYTDGPRAGEACVVKYFKSGTAMSETFFEKDIKAVDKTIQIVRCWNQDQIIGKRIVVNKPEVWTGSSNTNRGEKQLVEPFINDFLKWNSNTGWADEYSTWARVMQALSHYSYHLTEGRFVLCDLQGGYFDGGVFLTDPVIMSTIRRYGVTDMGPEGITNFFAHHECNEFCGGNWNRPPYPRRSMRAVKGTTMQITLPPRSTRDRPPVTYSSPY